VTVWGVVALAGALAAQGEAPVREAPARDVAARSEAERPKPSEAARVGFGELRKLRDGLKGLKGAERAQAQQRLGEACEGLATRLAAEPPAASRAWFEAGDAWRAQGDLSRAGAAFEKALAGGDERYRGRALFELAQVLRREKRWDDAVARYREAAGVEPESERAHDARVWIARCLDEKEDRDGALAAYRAAVDAAARPRQVIDASNWLAKALIARNDVDGADQALRHAEATVQPELDSDDADAERLKKALEEMSARRALQRARDRSGASAADAADLERGREHR
jgi:tetratricopeptide (TPR) repeat protein